MPESSLSLDYQAIIRALSRVLGTGAVYYSGTVAVAAGTVTLTGGAFPEWTSEAAINIDGQYYNTTARPTTTTLTISDTSLSVSAGRRYVVAHSVEENYSDTFQQLDEVIVRGLRSFYFPPPMPRGKDVPSATPHSWSFLRPTIAFPTTPGTATYPLPDDCGQVTADWVVRVGEVIAPVTLISEGQMQSLRLTLSDDGVPKYAQVAQIADFDPEIGQRFAVTFAPVPAGAYQVEFNYNIIPENLNPTNRYPLGGAVHSETILAAILAQAELDKDCEGGQYAGEFIKRLAASIEIDGNASVAQDFTYSLIPVEIGTYEWLQQEVGAALELSPNAATWDWTSRQRVDMLIQRGRMMFHQPLGHSHRWTFLRPLLSIAVNAPVDDGTIGILGGVVTLTGARWPTWAADGVFFLGTEDDEGSDTPYRVKARIDDTRLLLEDDSISTTSGESYTLRQNRYTLPSDFGGLDGPLAFRRGDDNLTYSVRIVDDLMLRQRDQFDFSTDAPQLASITIDRYEAAGRFRTVRRLNFWPQPDAAYTLLATYKVVPQSMSPGDLILGGPEHYETVLACCLAAAGKNSGFAEKLASSIRVDQTEHTPPTVGFNRDHSDYQWYDEYWDRDMSMPGYNNAPA